MILVTCFYKKSYEFITPFQSLEGTVECDHWHVRCKCWNSSSKDLTHHQHIAIQGDTIMSRIDEIWNSCCDFNQVQSTINRVLDHFPTLEIPSVMPSAFPLVNVSNDEENIVLTAELPGIDSEKIDLRVMKDSITIGGEISRPELSSEIHWVRKERKDRKFERTIMLPFEIDPESVEAVYEKGILTVRFQRVESEKPKRISIHAG